MRLMILRIVWGVLLLILFSWGLDVPERITFWADYGILPVLDQVVVAEVIQDLYNEFEAKHNGYGSAGPEWERFNKSVILFLDIFNTDPRSVLHPDDVNLHF